MVLNWLVSRILSIYSLNIMRSLKNYLAFEENSLNRLSKHDGLQKNQVIQRSHITGDVKMQEKPGCS